MTKQEQIEEMAEIVDKLYNVYTTPADDIAEGLYNAGYCKIPKGAVVLTREEWECLHNDYGKALYNARQQARKKTTKEIISTMKTMIINRRAEERSGLNLIYTTYSPERLLDDISDYVRITMNVEVNDEK